MITSFVTLTDAPWKEVLQFGITLFAILNPIAGVTFYLFLTENKARVEKLRTARKASWAILVILLISIWVGDLLLNIFGISIAAFRIGGGLIVILIGLDMLDFLNLSSGNLEPKTQKDIAVVPLAIPIIAGPGVIAVTLTEMQNTFDSIKEKIIISITTFIIVFLFWLIMRFAPIISKKLGEVGIDIMGKIMGMILVVMATQMILEGLIAVFPAWAGT